MNASDVLKYGHLTLLGTLDGLPSAAWETPGVCGVWSAKQIVAHLASYEEVLVDILIASLRPAPTPALDRFRELGDAFNDRAVAARDRLSPDAALAAYADAHAQVMALVADIPVETLRRPGTIPWYGAEYALDDLIVYMYYGHKREHAAQIAVFRDHLDHSLPAPSPS